jgi:homoserine dehydrogenase
VLAQISKILGDNMISIASAIQKETNITTQAAEIVLTTHLTREEAMQQALHQIEQLEVVKEISNFIRVEHI